MPVKLTFTNKGDTSTNITTMGKKSIGKDMKICALLGEIVKSYNHYENSMKFHREEKLKLPLTQQTYIWKSIPKEELKVRRAESIVLKIYL